MVKQKNNSTPTLKGFIYQFLVALKKCFELQEGESVYIETFGDVSILGGKDTSQIESKFYKSDLTDADHNVWNTLNNWLKDEFPLHSFSSLVLLTTQKVKSTSAWFGWNEKSTKDKLAILKDISTKYARKRSTKNTKTEKLVNVVLDESKSLKLKVVLEKFVIDNNALNDIKVYNSIKETYAKAIPNIRQEEFIRSMLGYVVSPKVIDNNWKISYEEFTREVNLIAQSLIDTTTQFPSKIKLKDLKHIEYNENLFVNKIRQIEYEGVILDAITDYVQTKWLIIKEIQVSKKISDSLVEYEDSLFSRHKVEYRKACRNCDSDVKRIFHSQNFYDHMMSSDEGTFYIYNSVPAYFHNGMLHILAEEEDNFSWLLKKCDSL
ncbi:hypothetical protein [Maribellus maritimus]|uniref:hypothetical protein n=1 Tax=Maribellus maritimus TaxID=2870838 RepID=UPI001EEA93D1|nr:hypothetical protein [Maribellus maritimus]MCG6189981.1 hypothetical protein [Maribellus maritimus]